MMSEASLQRNRNSTDFSADKMYCWVTGLLKLEDKTYRIKAMYINREGFTKHTFLLIMAEPASDQFSLPKRHLGRRELEIVSLISDGQTNKEIASTLGISENTVKTYIKRLFQRFGVHSRSQLIYELYQACTI